MSYGILRAQKFTAGSVKGIQIHDRRIKDKSHTNPDIDFRRWLENYDLCPARNENFNSAVKEKIERLNLDKAVRKDAIVMAQILVTSDDLFFHDLYVKTFDEHQSQSLTDYIDPKKYPDKRKEFFRRSYDFLAQRFGKDNIVSAIVHMDEKTPHMHFNFVPVTADGRLSAKDVLTKKSLTEMHDDFYLQVGSSYGLERGEGKDSGKRRTHMDTAEYKAATKELDDVRDQVAEVRQELSESFVRLEKVKIEVQDLQGEKKALEGELDSVGREIKQARGLLDDIKQALVVAVEKVKEKFDVSPQDMAWGDYRKKIQELKTGAVEDKRQNLIEKFLAIPEIKNLFEKFCLAQQKNFRHGEDRSR